MVKVLYVVPTMKSHYGVTSVVMNYCRHFNNENLQVSFLTLDDTEETLLAELRERGSDVYFMPRLSLAHIGGFYKFLNGFFSEHRDITAVHSHFYQLDSILFPIAKKYGVKACISHSHNTMYSEKKLRSIRNWVMSLPLPAVADYWAACSDSAGKFLYGRQYGTSPKTLRINNAVDCSQFTYDLKIRQQVRAELGMENKKVIGFIGRLCAQKNLSFLLERYKEMLSTVEDQNAYVLLLAGTGELEEELKAQTEHLGIKESVVFLGFRRDTARLLQAMDLFVMTSAFEGLPVVLLEAQATGLACAVSSRIPKASDISGLVQFLDLEDPERWVRLLANAAGSQLRTSGFAALVKAGYEIGTQADALCRLYLSLAAVED